MPKFPMDEEIEKLRKQIAALVQTLDKGEGRSNFLQAGRSRQVLAEARDQAKEVSAQELALGDHTRRLQAGLDGIREGLVVVDRRGEILLYNTAAEQLLNLQESDSTINRWLDRHSYFEPDSKTVIPKEETAFVKALQARFAENPAASVETGLLSSGDQDEHFTFQAKADAEKKVVSLSTRVANASSHASDGILLVFSEVKDETKNLAQKLELLNAAVQRLKEGILVVDEAGAFLLLNAAAKKLLMTEKSQGNISEWLKTHEVHSMHSKDAGAHESDETGSGAPPDVSQTTETSGKPLLAHENPFARAATGERLSDEPFLLKHRESQEQQALRITVHPLANKDKKSKTGKAKPKFSAVVVHGYSDSPAVATAEPDDTHRKLNDELQNQLTANLLKIESLSGELSDRDKSLADLNRDLERLNSQVSADAATAQRSKIEKQLAIRDAATTALTEAISFTDAAPYVMQAICDADNWLIGFIWEVDKATQTLRRLDLWQVPKSSVGDIIKWSRTAKFALGEGIPGNTLSARKHIFAGSIESSDAALAEVVQGNLKASLAFPIFVDSQVEFVMQFFSAEARSEDADVTSAILDVSKQLTQYLEGKRAEEQRAHLNAIVDSTDDAMLFLSLEGKVIRWNPPAEKLFDQGASLARGKPFVDLVSTDFASKITEGIRLTKNCKDSEPFEIAYLKPNADSVHLSIRLAPVKSVEGGVIGISAVARDMSEYEQKAAKVAELKKSIATQFSEVTKIHGQLTEANEQIAELEARLKSANAELNALHAQSGETTDVLNQRSEDLDSAGIKVSKLTEELRVSDRFKQLVLNSIEQQIRAPINAIMGLSDLLTRSAGLGEESINYGYRIHDSGALLADLVDDIVAFKEIEDGQLSLACSDFSLTACVERAAAAVAKSAKHKKLSLLTFVAPEVPAQVVGDPRRLVHVIARLLEAVIRVTDRGGVVLRASLVKFADAQATVRLSFSDTGSGVATQSSRQPFKDLTQTTGDILGGKNLSLSIARRLVQMMGGEISMDPSGSSMLWLTFTFNVGRSALPPRPLHETVKSARILAVDGPAGASKIISAYCAAWDVQCDWVVTGDEALSTLQRNAQLGTPYQVVVMEKVMFGMNGYALAAAIKERANLENTKLILFSPYEDGQLERVGLEAFSRVVKGPMNQTLFFEHLTSVLVSDQSGVPSRPRKKTSDLSAALERLAMGQELQPYITASMSKSNSQAITGELTMNSAQALADLAAARKIAAEKTRKITKHSMPSMAPVSAKSADSAKYSDTAKFSASASTPNVQEITGPTHTSSAGSFSPAASPPPPPQATTLPQPPQSTQTPPPAPDASGTPQTSSQNQDANPAEFMDVQKLKEICGETGMIEIMQEFINATEDLLKRLENAVQQKDVAAQRRIALEMETGASALGAKKIEELTASFQTLPLEEQGTSEALCRSLRHSFDELKNSISPQLKKSH